MIRVRGRVPVVLVGGLLVIVGGAAVPAAAADPPPATAPDAGEDAIDVREAVVRLGAEAEYGLPAPVVDRLPGRSVLRITATGFPPSTTSVVEQCSVAGCANAFPVAFDANGYARFQYFVTDAFASGFSPRSTCGAGEPPCVVRLGGDGRAAFLTTVFRDPAPAPRRVWADPGADGLESGATVRVSVSGFVPGERVQAVLCAAPATFGTERCGQPGVVAPFTIGADGRGATTMVVRQGRVGSADATCGRATTCAIVVTQPRSLVPGATLLVSFSAGPGARYDASRLLGGLAAALALLALAFVLARTTDWRKPTEADTPDLDRVVLAD